MNKTKRKKDYSISFLIDCIFGSVVLEFSSVSLRTMNPSEKSKASRWSKAKEGIFLNYKEENEMIVKIIKNTDIKILNITIQLNINNYL